MYPDDEVNVDVKRLVEYFNLPEKIYQPRTMKIYEYERFFGSVDNIIINII